jgi:hypothetical protein
MARSRRDTLVIPKPKKRIPVAPPRQVHEDAKKEEKLRPSGRKSKHKRASEENSAT